MAFDPERDVAVLAVCWHDMASDIDAAMIYEFWASTKEEGTVKFAEAFANARAKGGRAVVFFALWIEGEGHAGRKLCGYASMDSLPIPGRSNWRDGVWKAKGHWGPTFDITWLRACDKENRPTLPAAANKINDADTVSPALALQMMELAAKFGAPILPSRMLSVRFRTVDGLGRVPRQSPRSHPLEPCEGDTHSFRVGFEHGVYTFWLVRLEAEGRVPPLRFLAEISGGCAAREYLDEQIAQLRGIAGEYKSWPALAPSDCAGAEAAYICMTSGKHCWAEFYELQC